MIEIQMGQKPFKAKVLEVNEYAKKEDASSMYQIIP